MDGKNPHLLFYCLLVLTLLILLLLICTKLPAAVAAASGRRQHHTTVLVGAKKKSNTKEKAESVNPAKGDAVATIFDGGAPPACAKKKMGVVIGKDGRWAVAADRERQTVRTLVLVFLGPLF